MTEATQATKTAKAKAEEVDVAMTDGRIVTFAGKRKMLKESFVKDGVVHVRLDIRNGETRTFAVPASLTNKFIAHGAEQKLGDEIAGLDDLDDITMAIDGLTSRLANGEWSVARESGGMAGTSILARALAEAKGLTMDVVKAFLAKKSQAEKVALRANPTIKPIVERLEAEKAAKGKGAAVDTDALLGELDAATAGNVTETEATATAEA